MPRLNILTDIEQLEFDYPPTLTVEARAVCFAIDDALNSQIKKLRGETNKVGFLLQYAYFKASRRFFLIKRFRQEDVEYACKLLDFRKRDVKIQKYKDSTLDAHREKILSLFNCKSYLAEKSWLEKEIILKVERFVEPRALFFDVLHQMHNHQIEIPTYYALSELISEHYISYEKTLLDKIEVGMSDERRQVLQSLLSNTANKYDTKLLSYKTVFQSLKPKAIQANVKIFEQIRDLVSPLWPLINSLSLTPQSCEYYAPWVKKAKISQLKQFADERKLYLRLVAFLQHQYYSRQDIFVDIFLRAVRSKKNTALHQLKNEDQLSRSERRTAVKHLTKSRQAYKSLIDEITEVTHSVVFTDTGKVQKISELLQKHADEENKKEQKKIERFEKSLDEMAKDKNYFDILENLSRKLQNRVSDILKVISFNPENSDKTLLNAADYYKNKDGEVTINAPQEFLSSDEKDAIVSKNGAFRTSLYKILLFIHIADGVILHICPNSVTGTQ